MSCEVCIGGGDYDGANEFEFSGSSMARKPHRCCECRRVIEAKEVYHIFTAKYDGVITRSKTCAQCEDIRAVFSCGESAVLGELWEAMEYAAFPNLTTASECFTELSAASKAFILDKWREWKGL